MRAKFEQIKVSYYNREISELTKQEIAQHIQGYIDTLAYEEQGELKMKPRWFFNPSVLSFEQVKLAKKVLARLASDKIGHNYHKIIQLIENTQDLNGQLLIQHNKNPSSKNGLDQCLEELKAMLPSGHLQYTN